VKKRVIMVLATLSLTAGLCFYGIIIQDNQVLASYQADVPQSTKPAPAENVWSIGMYTGSSPFHLSAPVSISNPVITAQDVTDIDADVVAHPFLAVSDSRYHMFFTAKHSKTKVGGIGLAESPNGLNWKYRQIVLDEPFHLAYPFVFQWQDEYYMIPESYETSSIRLYKATDFPTKWQYEKDLIQGHKFVSASVVHYQNMWWMFVSHPGNDTLRLYYAKDLMDGWTQHPHSPLVQKDKNIARPGGRPIIIDDTLYRIAQDDYPKYGNQTLAFEITDISATSYQEKMVIEPLVKASGNGWNADGMHHVDLHAVSEKHWLAATDGFQKIFR